MRDAHAAATTAKVASSAARPIRSPVIGIPYIRPMRPLVPALAALVAYGATALPAPTTVVRRLAPDRSLRTARPPRLQPGLRGKIESLIASVQGSEVAVWYHDFATGETLAVNAAVPFHAASTMKLPVMIELFRRADAGTLSLDQTTSVENRFRSIVDGSPYTLSAGDDSDSSLYALAGRPITYRELNERMITKSSNLATNVLIDLLDPKVVNATSSALGAGGMTVLRGVEDSKAFEKGLNNTTTARALGALLDAIEHGRAASRKSCDAMRAVLLRQTERGEIPAGLPPGTKVAHKTGWITATTHDAAIIYRAGRAPYVLVVLTRKIPDRPIAQRLMADISRAVWEAATASR